MDEAELIGLFTAETMRGIDRAAIDEIGIPGAHLMERAGAAVAAEIIERGEPATAVVVTGRGNNAGDGFVVARELHSRGLEVAVVQLAEPRDLSPDARLNHDILGRLEIEVVTAAYDDGEPTEEAIAALLMADVIVDAIFGTGFHGAAEGAEATLINLINQMPGEIVSIDIASGVDASSGEVAGPAVDADLTVALHAAKIGHFVTPGGVFSGEVVEANIGIPPECDVDADAWVLTEAAVAPLIVAKGSLDHKRSVGTMLVVGGAAGMGGAAQMAAMGGLRAGAGLVQVAQPRDARGPAPFVEVIGREVAGADGRLTTDSAAEIGELAKGVGALVVGPGLGRGDDTAELVRRLIALEQPLLLDADALYALGTDLEALAERDQPTVLTPHEGELARLLGTSAAEVAAKRLESVRTAAQRSAAVVVLKGEATLIAAPDGSIFVVPTGNPGLATPGSGDVLSGVIGAQLAKGTSALAAACLGAYLHGLAADLAATDAVGSEGMIAGDLFAYLPVALERLKTGPTEAAHEH